MNAPFPRRRAAAGAILLLAGSGLAWGAGAFAQSAADPPRGLKASASLTKGDLESFGINTAFIVAVRLADDHRILIAEHRPGQASALHVLRADGAYDFKFEVPSPQLVDFTVDAGGRVFLVGSLGTRFYSADLAGRSAKLIASSLPDRPGFRALPPVSIMRTAEGPVVYGLFYESKEVSREVGFARIAQDGTATNVFAATDWNTRFGEVLSSLPDPRLQSALIVAQDAHSGNTKADPKPKRLILAQVSGSSRTIDTGDDIFGTAWSPSSFSFAYIRRRGAQQDLVTASPGSAPLTLASGAYFSPAFLNGGKTLLVAAKETKGMSVWTMRFPTGDLKRISLPEGPCVHVTGPSGKGLAAWGPWGLRTFTVTPG